MYLNDIYLLLNIFKKYIFLYKQNKKRYILSVPNYKRKIKSRLLRSLLRKAQLFNL